MAGANALRRVMKQKAIRASGLVPMVFDDQRLALQACRDEWREGRAGNMNDIGRANQPPEVKKARLANHREWQRGIIEISSWRLRHQGNFEFVDAVRVAQLSQTTTQRLNDGFDSTDTRRKKVRVNQELHGRFF